MAVGVGKRNGPDLTREERKEEEGELELEIKARRIAAEVGCCKSDVVTRELSMTKVSERVVRCFFFFFFLWSSPLSVLSPLTCPAADGMLSETKNAVWVGSVSL